MTVARNGWRRVQSSFFFTPRHGRGNSWTLEKKMTKPIKVQSVLIAPLIFDLRERACSLLHPVDRDSQPGQILRYCGVATPMAIGPPDSLLISSGFVVFERIGRRLCHDTRARNQRRSLPSWLPPPHRTRRIVFRAMRFD